MISYSNVFRVCLCSGPHNESNEPIMIIEPQHVPCTGTPLVLRVGITRDMAGDSS